MSAETKIEWTHGPGFKGVTWNPVLGCEKVSAGCDNCYAIANTHRLAQNPNPKLSEPRQGLTVVTDRGLDWTGEVRTLPDRLDQPLRWTQPRMVFVNSLSDLFHDAVPDEFIAQVFTVMAATPQHTYQVLTKRHGRMKSLLTSERFRWLTYDTWPSPNVWLGVSVEDQKRADLRVLPLLDTPAAVRFLSCEPLLGPVNLYDTCATVTLDNVGLDWVIIGGESGRGHRPLQLSWVRALATQVRAAGIACFVKQLGSAFGPHKGGDMATWPADLRIREWPTRGVIAEAAEDTRVSS